MKYDTITDFEDELREAAKKLKDRTDRNASLSEGAKIAGIGCDFELPYSSLPSLSGGRWLRT